MQDFYSLLGYILCQIIGENYMAASSLSSSASVGGSWEARVQAFEASASKKGCNPQLLLPRIERLFQEIHSQDRTSTLKGRLVKVIQDLTDRFESLDFSGTFSQQTGRNGCSACTPCSQAFLATVLREEHFKGLTTEGINQIVNWGLHVYDDKQSTHDAERRNGSTEQHNETIANDETADVFGLEEILESSSIKELPEGNSIEFFGAELKNLESLVEKGKQLGVVLTCNGKTSALALFKKEDQIQYVLFDSHGKTPLNPNEDQAFVKFRTDRIQVAELLSELIPYAPPAEVSPELLEGYNEEEKEAMMVQLLQEGNETKNKLGISVVWIEKGVEIPVFSSYEPVSPFISTPGRPDAQLSTAIDQQQLYIFMIAIFAILAAIVAQQSGHFPRITSHTGPQGQLITA